MNITSPYKIVEQNTCVIIKPHDMNSGIRNHLKFNLKKKVEKKCNKHGYVDEIYKILNISDGIMIPENLLGNAIYNVSYQCKLCIPVENSIIIGQIKLVTQELIVANNGSIMIFITRENIDPTYWNINDNFTHKKNKNVKLEVGKYVCIQVINKRINKNDVQIKVIGKLLEIATENEVKKYFGSKIEEEVLASTTNFI